MARRGRKRGSGADFEKVKRKVGRKTRPSNETIVKASVSSLHVGSQATRTRDPNAPVNSRGLSLFDCLHKLTHPNAKQRSNYLNGVQSLITHEYYADHRAAVGGRVAQLLLDDTSAVRRNALAVLFTIYRTEGGNVTINGLQTTLIGIACSALASDVDRVPDALDVLDFFVETGIGLSSMIMNSLYFLVIRLSSDGGARARKTLPLALTYLAQALVVNRSESSKQLRARSLVDLLHSTTHVASAAQINEVVCIAMNLALADAPGLEPGFPACLRVIARVGTVEDVSDERLWARLRLLPYEEAPSLFPEMNISDVNAACAELAAKAGRWELTRCCMKFVLPEALDDSSYDRCLELMTSKPDIHFDWLPFVNVDSLRFHRLVQAPITKDVVLILLQKAQQTFPRLLCTTKDEALARLLIADLQALGAREALPSAFCARLAFVFEASTKKQTRSGPFLNWPVSLQSAFLSACGLDVVIQALPFFEKCWRLLDQGIRVQYLSIVGNLRSSAVLFHLFNILVIALDAELPVDSIAAALGRLFSIDDILPVIQFYDLPETFQQKLLWHLSYVFPPFLDHIRQSQDVLTLAIEGLQSLASQKSVMSQCFMNKLKSHALWSALERHGEHSMQFESALSELGLR